MIWTEIFVFRHRIYDVTINRT